jgi:transcriptional regulator with XRE-family HTH domain
LDAAGAFGRVLRRLRQKAGLSQEAFGHEADLRRTYVSILELGKQQPTLTTILKVAKALKISAKEVIGLVEAEMTGAKSKRS